MQVDLPNLETPSNTPISPNTSPNISHNEDMKSLSPPKSFHNSSNINQTILLHNAMPDSTLIHKSPSSPSPTHSHTHNQHNEQSVTPTSTPPVGVCNSRTSSVSPTIILDRIRDPRASRLLHNDHQWNGSTNNHPKS